jgi:hypothetical protein
MPLLVKHYLSPGERVTIRAAYSEVCMHMRVAGTLMQVELLQSPQGYHSAQLYTMDGRMFSAPITTGEAGLYWEEGRYYCYPEDK